MLLIRSRRNVMSVNTTLVRAEARKAKEAERRNPRRSGRIRKLCSASCPGKNNLQPWISRGVDTFPCARTRRDKETARDRIEISTKYLSLAQQDRDDTMERNGDLGQRCLRRKGSVTHRSRQYRERYPDSCCLCFPSLISVLTRSAVSSRGRCVS